VTYFWNFGTPFISQKLLKLETSNLVRRLTTSGPKQKNAKLGQKGSWRGHVTYFYNFGTPSISRERLKLETSNLPCRLATGGCKRSNAKLGQKESIRGHVTYFFKFWDPLYISGAAEARNFKLCTQIGHWGS